MSDLSPRHPANWPPLQRALLCLAAFLLVLLSGWQGYVQAKLARLESLQQETQTLKDSYVIKAKKMPDLPQLQSQLQRASQDFQALGQQLSPANKRLLIDLASAAQTHGLTLELAKPGNPEVTKDYTRHAVDMRLNGHYHDLQRFTIDLAVSRQRVVLSELQLSANDDDTVTMHAVALSYHQTPGNDVSVARP